jgi:hypothetical protein
VISEIRRTYPGWTVLSLTWPNEKCPYWMSYLLRGDQALEVYSSGNSILV